MAIADISKYEIAVLDTLNSADTVTILDPQRAYDFTHTGVDTAGSPAADPIMLSVATDIDDIPTTDTGYDADENKYVLISGKSVPIGPGVHRVAYRTQAAASTPIISVASTPKFFRS